MPESQQSAKGTNMIKDRILQRPQDRVLDIGCGEGKWGKLLRGFIEVDGIEVWEPYIDKYNLKKYYGTLYNIDMLEFKDYNMYDIVILGDVFEHVPYGDGIVFLNKLKVSVDKIYLTIPVTVCIQDGNAIGNPYETHHYQWSDKEIQIDLGFKLLNVSVNDNGLVAVGCYEWSRS